MHSLATMFKALADESRLRILSLLFLSGELCVCDIEEVMGFTQTKVSRHLAYLRRVGLVEDRRQGLWMLYSIAQPKNDEQKHVLEVLAGLLRSNPIARRDARRLAGKIKTGCCATYSIVKPMMIQATIELQKN